MKNRAYITFDGGIFGIKRGRRTDEYGSGGRVITPSSRRRIWILLDKCEQTPCYASYGTLLYTLYMYIPLDKQPEV